LLYREKRLAQGKCMACLSPNVWFIHFQIFFGSESL
jgi:hypothetical protein